MYIIQKSKKVYTCGTLAFSKAFFMENYVTIQAAISHILRYSRVPL